MTAESDLFPLTMGRRPNATDARPFGHVPVEREVQNAFAEIVSDRVRGALASSPVPLEPYASLEETNEVFATTLQGFDAQYQHDAAWSLERLVAGVRGPGFPAVSPGEADTRQWSYYALRVWVDGRDCVLVRKTNPMAGLNPNGKVMAKLVGGRLAKAEEAIFRFDHKADLVVIDDDVFVFQPQRIEQLFVDADAVKARAETSVAALLADITVGASDATVEALVAACEASARTGRRVERLTRDGVLRNAEFSSIADELEIAGYGRDWLGEDELNFEHPERAGVLLDVLEDRFWRPKFYGGVRRASSWRTVR
jgi:hypothetical protein